MHHDRRDVPRNSTLLRATALDGGPPMMVQDVSLGGMLVTCESPRSPGCMVPLRFRLPSQPRAIRATCRVVNLVQVPRGVGMALVFLKLAPDAEQAIHRFVDARPLPVCRDWSARLNSWLVRIVEDCKELRALART